MVFSFFRPLSTIEQEQNVLSTRIIYENEKIQLCFTNTLELEKDKFKNWDKNRPPDPVRISHLIHYLNTNNITLVPGVISVWVNKGDYYVYDGIHRLQSAFSVEKQMYLVIQYFFTDKEQDIIDDFLNLNKSISVPSIYLEEDNYIKKMVCQTLANELCQRYPKFMSPSRKPYRYNFNRDNLIEFFSSLEIDFTKTSVDKIILNELDGLNYRAQEFVRRNNISCPEKCHYYHFYLFFLDKSLIKTTLEKAVRQF